MVNTPIPSSLRSEAKKAANIIREFTIPNTKAGPDNIIPAGLVENAAGLAILTVVKVGFLVTARGGSGIVIARLNDGTWSAPSALGIAGLGGGLEIGAEVTDFVIILNKQSAVDAFSKGGNLTLGGNFTVAAGPLGRNLEGDVSVRSPAAIYTYSKTKGLFAGISIEGSCLIERKDANKKFYGEPLRAVDILTGRIEPPPACNDLYAVLDNHREMFKKAMVAQAKSHAKREVEKQATSRGYGGFVERVKSLKVKKESHRMRRTASGTITKNSKTTSIYESTEFCDSSSDDEYVPAYKQNSTSQVVMQRSQSVKSRPVSTPRSTDTKRKSYDQTDSGLSVKQSAPCPSSGSNWDQTIRVQAIWAFQGQLPCDLTFMPGDIIDVLTSTGSQNDWWEGNFNGHIGIFPANFTKLL